MKKYVYTKIRVNKDTPIEVINLYKERINYDNHTGLLTNLVTGTVYNKLTSKGYIQSVSIRYNNIEYYWCSHRLCWFLATNEILNDDIQIDHVNISKSDNRFVNLRKCTNKQNQYNTGSRNGTSIYKGVSFTIDKKPSGEYETYVASISIDGKTTKIGRFKDAVTAAKYYDSAAKFYFKEFAYVNFNEEFIPPMNIEDLRDWKRNKKHLKWKSEKNLIFL
jgi:hypothetical protein